MIDLQRRRTTGISAPPEVRVALLKKLGTEIDDQKRWHQIRYISTTTGAQHQIQKGTSGDVQWRRKSHNEQKCLIITSRQLTCRKKRTGVEWSQIRNPYKDKNVQKGSWSRNQINTKLTLTTQSSTAFKSSGSLFCIYHQSMITFW